MQYQQREVGWLKHEQTLSLQDYLETNYFNIWKYYKPKRLTVFEVPMCSSSFTVCI